MPYIMDSVIRDFSSKVVVIDVMGAQRKNFCLTPIKVMIQAQRLPWNVDGCWNGSRNGGIIYIYIYRLYHLSREPETTIDSEISNLKYTPTLKLNKKKKPMKIS